MFKYTFNVFYCLALVLLLVCCDSNDTDDEMLFLTSTGQEISMDGVWRAECVSQGPMYLSEDFTFAGESLTIDIRVFDTAGCQTTPVNNERITIDFTRRGTYEAFLSGQMVTTNKIEGTESSDQSNETSFFKQGLYIDDASGQLVLYHGVFGEDGGRLTSDGFPLDLFPIAITKM